MWLVGLLAGLVLGAVLTDRLQGAVWGAMLGAMGGYAFKRFVLAPVERESRALKDELAALRLTLEDTGRRLGRLEAERRSDVGAPPAAAPPAAFELPPMPTPTLARAAESGPMPANAPPPEPTRASTETVQPRAGVTEESPLSRLTGWFLGGNTLVRVGVVVLFFGLAFLLKFAYEHTHVPTELRLIGVALGAAALLFVGWRLRYKRPGYALALQGGGIAALYLTVFASLRLFALLPPSVAFVLLLAIAALSAALAVLQNSQTLAILGAGGGFLAPILASTGAGSHVMLFSYYALLNLGILAVAWFKAWRPLNLVGFVFTFAIGTLWGGRYYRPELFASTEPFLVLFFAMYLAIPVLFATRAAASKLGRYVDATLIFGVPLVAFALQLRLVRQFEFGAAFSAFVLGGLYLFVARLLFVRGRAALRMLVEAFLALGVVFTTLAIPFALGGRWTAAAWALEGAALVWVGIRQQRTLARAAGILLQVGASAAFMFAWRQTPDAPVFNSVWLGCAFLAVAGLFSSWYLERHARQLGRIELGVASALLAWGLMWWLGGGANEIGAHAHERFFAHGILLLFAATAATFELLHRRLPWPSARYPAFALLPAAAVVLLADATLYLESHPCANLGWLAWPATLAVCYWTLRRHDNERDGPLDYLHAGALWLITALLAWELEWLLRRWAEPQTAWPILAWALTPGALLILLALRATRLVWPAAKRPYAYLVVGAAPLAGWLWCWIVFATFASNGDPAPLPFLPVLNPLDLVMIGALLAIALWLRETARAKLVEAASPSMSMNVPVYVFLATGAFVAANGALLRGLHHYAGVPYALEPMLNSMLVQAALSIFWSGMALATMVVATRLRVRVLWLAGAALMGVVVIKLFLVDLSNIGGVERIVSFIGVGVLMLLIGYLSPVPPRFQEGAR